MGILILSLACLVGCGSTKSETEEIQTLEDLEHATIGVVTGNYATTFIYDMFPEATIREYNLISDMVLALSQGKLDAFVTDESYYTTLRWSGTDVRRLEEPLDGGDYGIVFKKGEHQDLQEQLNEFIAEIDANGIHDELEAKWFGDTEPTEFLSTDSLTGENGTISVITCAEVKPFGYMKNGELVGYDFEVMILFAEKYGYQLDFTNVSFTAVLAGVTSGAYDVGVSGFTITEERKESVDFTSPYHHEDLVMVVNGDNTQTASTWDSLKTSFHKTFVEESRWQLILQGILTTLVISLFAVIGGTAFGFLVYMLVRAENKVISSIAKGFACLYSKLVAGMPVLVILMILFYVVFATANLSGVLVAIIGFSLTFGAFVYENLTLTVNGVDFGQTEAAYALGYTRNKTFFRIVLPQAMKMFVPVYSAEIVNLIKATSIVGYIAVNDLTKMGDIIRASTYEAFFPLIAVAIIYFIITTLITWLLGNVRGLTEPKKRKDKNILKGVVR